MKKITILFSTSFLLFALTAVAQEPKGDPIVIVPGTMASWNTEILFDKTPDSVTIPLEDWTFTPGVKQYDQLVQALKDEGLVENEDFFIAFYDWRQGNASSSKNYLTPTIDKALAHSESGKVDIVAHSMGGLVARSYIQSGDYRGDVDQFIMLGTPNHGSGDVYTLWEGGDIPDNWDPVQKFALNSYNWYLQLHSETAEDLYDTIHTYVPSVKELLPTYNYLIDKETNESKPVAQMQEWNTFLVRLNSNAGRLRLANRTGSVYTIVGTGEATVGNIPVVAHTEADGKLWIDGKPDPLTPERNDTEGDNRVLLSSAMLTEPPGLPGFNEASTPWQKFAQFFLPRAHATEHTFDQRVIGSGHGALPTNAIDEVFRILGLSEPEGSYDVLPEPDQVLSFWFASPVSVKVTDPLGRTTTRDMNEIPGATYDGQDDPLGFKMILIEDPVEGDYLVELTGLADGSYHFATAHFGNGPEIIKTVEKSVAQNEKIGYTVAFDPESVSSVFISDPFVPEEPGPTTALSLTEALLAHLDGLATNGVLTAPVHAQLRAPLIATHALLSQAQDLLASSHPHKERNATTLKRFALVQMNRFVFSVERNRANLTPPLIDDLRRRAQEITDLLSEKTENTPPPPAVSPFF